MKRMMLAALMLAACGDIGFGKAVDAVESEFAPEGDGCGRTLECMMESCDYNTAASESRAQGYVAGCVDACMAVTGATGGRGAAAAAWVACNTGDEECAAKIDICEDP